MASPISSGVKAGGHEQLPACLRAVHRPAADGTLPFARFPAAVVQPAEDLTTCITAIAAQSGPARLATLEERQANPRLKRILYYLAEARAAGADLAAVVDQTQQRNGSAGTPRAPMVKTSLLRNLKICGV